MDFLDKLIGLVRRKLSKDRLNCKGYVSVSKFYGGIPKSLDEKLAMFRKGSAERLLVNSPNVITIGGHSAVSRLIGNVAGPSGTNIVKLGDDSEVEITNSSELFITTMKFGNPGSVTAEDPTDIDLETLIAGVDKSVSVSYPSDIQGHLKIAFSATLGTSEANGSSITEEGLYTSNDILFARKTFSGGIAKNSSFALEFEHQIIF